MLGEAVQKPTPFIHESVAAVALLFLTFSIVFGGPLGIVFRGERHLLLAVLVSASLIELIRGGVASALQFVRAHPIVLAPGLFAAINLVWVLRAVFHDGAPSLSLAAQDAQSLLLPLLSTLVFVSYRQRAYLSFGWIRWVVIMGALLAGIQICIWLFLLVHPVPQQIIEKFEALVFGTNEGVNIVRQKSAGLYYTRIIWISSYWFAPCFALAPLVVRKPIALMIIQTVIAAAMIVSFTKGIWLAMVVSGLVLLLSVTVPWHGPRSWRLLRSRVAMISLAAILLAGTITNFATYMAGDAGIFARMFFSTEGLSAPDDEGVYDRIEQTRKLIKMWQEQPLFGHGYGAYVPGLIRHQERPFLYEMVPFALLMKLGIVGFGLYCGFLAFVSYRLWSLSACSGTALALLSAFVGYICQIHTNPVFFSFTGMFIFSILLSLWISLEVSKAAGNFNVRE